MRQDLRTDLGKGWFLVTDLPIPPPDPRADTLHLEGPAGMIVYVPFESFEEAFHKLGIRRRRRKFRAKPGPAPKLWPRVVPTIRGFDHDPTQHEVANVLDVDDSALARAHKGIPWRGLVRFARR
jgi:hypothetical protein